MNQHAQKPLADEPSERARKQSGTRRISIDPSEPPTSSAVHSTTAWAVDQDAIPTQPANEPPTPVTSVPHETQEQRAVTIDLPLPHDDVRDTIPAPPPDPTD